VLKTALANLRAHKARMLLSSFTVLLGVGFVAGTLIFTDSIKASFYATFAREAQNVDAAVAPSDGLHLGGGLEAHGKPLPALSPASLDAVRALPGVAAAEGRVFGTAPVLGKDGKIVKQHDSGGYGISFPADAALMPIDMSSGRAPAAATEAALDKSTADDRHFAVGESITVLDHSDARRTFTLVGIFDSSSSKTYDGQSIVAFDTKTALDVTGRPGFEEIVARAKPGVSQAALAADLRALPSVASAGDKVYDGHELTRELALNASSFAGNIGTALLVFAIIAALVSALVIQNTFAILVAQRARELALMRCVGATRRQVFVGTVVEAAIFGLLASVAGFFAGIGLAAGIGRLLNLFDLNVPTDKFAVHPTAAFISIGLGLVLTVGSSILPARAATRVAPIQALSAQQGETRVTKKAGRIRIGVGLLFVLGGLGLAYSGMQSTDANQGLLVLTAGACVVFLGVLALGPVIVAPIIRVLGWLPGRIFGPTARLASANASRNPRRVAATTAALTIGITLVTMFTVVTASIKSSTTSSITKHYPLDYQVVADRGRNVPAAAVERLKALPQVSLAAAEYDGKATVAGQQEQVGSMDPNGIGILIKPIMKRGAITDVVPGTTALLESQLSSLKTGFGQTVTLTAKDGTAHSLKVVGVYTDSGVGMPEMVVAAQDFRTYVDDKGARAVDLLAKPGGSPSDTRLAVENAVADDPLLSVYSVEDYKKTLSSALDQILALFSGLLGLAVLIALIGIANTLSLSVIERTRESALLRALGLTKPQLRRMLMAEAMLMSVLGVALGVVMGTSFGWALVHMFVRSSGEGGMTFPAGSLLVYILAGGLAGVLAAVVPARRAARQTVAAAITDV
jgi:putative ABC transport system permease protein